MSLCIPFILFNFPFTQCHASCCGEHPQLFCKLEIAIYLSTLPLMNQPWACDETVCTVTPGPPSSSGELCEDSPAADVPAVLVGLDGCLFPLCLLCCVHHRTLTGSLVQELFKGQSRLVKECATVQAH